MGWTHLRAARAASVAAVDKLVLLVIASYSDPAGRCYPGMAQLALDCGVHRRTVERCIARLAEAGLLTVLRGGGRGHGNEFLVPEKVGAQGAGRRAQADTETPALGRGFEGDTPRQECLSLDDEKLRQPDPETTALVSLNPGGGVAKLRQPRRSFSGPYKERARENPLNSQEDPCMHGCAAGEEERPGVGEEIESTRIRAMLQRAGIRGPKLEELSQAACGLGFGDGVLERLGRGGAEAGLLVHRVGEWIEQARGVKAAAGQASEAAAARQAERDRARGQRLEQMRADHSRLVANGRIDALRDWAGARWAEFERDVMFRTPGADGWVLELLTAQIASAAKRSEREAADLAQPALLPAIREVIGQPQAPLARPSAEATPGDEEFERRLVEARKRKAAGPPLTLRPAPCAQRTGGMAGVASG